MYLNNGKRFKSSQYDNANINIETVPQSSNTSDYFWVMNSVRYADFKNIYIALVIVFLCGEIR